jgi:hypothetical protein
MSFISTTTSSTLDWREYWRVHGTSWRSLFEVSLDRLCHVVVSACPTCGAAPCINPTFCQLCRDAEARKRPPPAQRFDISAPQPTVEALMYSLRQRGVKALEEPETKRRLSELSDRQVIEVGNRLQKLNPDIARAWNAADVETLFQARTK